jgi:hypothetical protein
MDMPKSVKWNRTDSTPRSSLPPHPEAHLLLVRLPCGQDPQVYVHPHHRHVTGTRTDTQQSTGARRRCEGRPPVPAACDTSRPSTASSATDSAPARPPAPRALQPQRRIKRVKSRDAVYRRDDGQRNRCMNGAGFLQANGIARHGAFCHPSPGCFPSA